MRHVVNTPENATNYGLTNTRQGRIQDILLSKRICLKVQKDKLKKLNQNHHCLGNKERRKGRNRGRKARKKEKEKKREKNKTYVPFH